MIVIIGYSLTFYFMSLTLKEMSAQNEISAEQILNNYDEESLQNILYKYGDIKNSKIIAKEIVTYRNKKNNK